MDTHKKWTSDDMPDQTGRIALVTGANSGIGFEAAKALALKNAQVILACRNVEKGKSAEAEIKAEFPEAKTEVMKLDLSSQKSVKEFAAEFKNKHNKLDLLINNAGVMMPPYSKTEDGFELQFGTNHLGHFTLTALLFDHIKSTPDSRIVNVSSAAHKMGKMDFDDLNREKEYKRAEAYGQSKLANLLFTYELQRRLSKNGTKTKAVAAHPGWTTTNLQRHISAARFLNPVFGQKQHQGAWPTLMAASHPAVKGGEYYGPGGFMEMKGHPKKVKSNEASHDQKDATRLWQVSEELTGQKFEV